MLQKTDFQCCFSKLESNSDKARGQEGSRHWLAFKEIRLSNSPEYDYITLLADFTNNTVKLYSKGGLIVETTCSHDYLVSGTLIDKNVPFTIGLMVDGVSRTEHYSKFDLYACRLYTRVLSDTEIHQNYVATTNYHDELIK